MPLRIVRMQADHKVTDFDCGDQRRNHWLQARALENQNANYSVTYVSLNTQGEVVGFYSLSSSSIARQTLPRNLRHGAPEPVPMVLLGQLAIHVTAQGKRLGDRLVVDACKRTLQAADIIGCRFLGVHPAEPWLVRYYEGFGLTLIAGITPALMLIAVPRLRALLTLGQP